MGSVCCPAACRAIHRYHSLLRPWCSAAREAVCPRCPADLLLPGRRSVHCGPAVAGVGAALWLLLLWLCCWR